MTNTHQLYFSTQASTEMARSFLTSLKARVGSTDDCSNLWLKLQEAKDAFMSDLSASGNK